MKKNMSRNLLVPDVFTCRSDGQAWKAKAVIEFILYEKKKINLTCEFHL